MDSVLKQLMSIQTDVGRARIAIEKAGAMADDLDQDFFDLSEKSEIAFGFSMAGTKNDILGDYIFNVDELLKSVHNRMDELYPAFGGKGPSCKSYEDLLGLIVRYRREERFTRLLLRMGMSMAGEQALLQGKEPGDEK